MKQTITAGTTGNPIYPNIGSTVTAIPGASGTMTVQYSTSEIEEVRAGAGTWQTWSNGTVSTTTADTLLGKVTAVRASATTSDGTFEVTL